MLNTQKNRKMKKPWKALKITKRTWKAREAAALPNPVTVNAAKSHVRPKRDMIPAILMSSLITVFLFIFSLLRPSVFRVCLMRTLITMTKMTALKIRMANMGPKKAPKNTPMSSMKQLGRRRKQTHQCSVCY